MIALVLCAIIAQRATAEQNAHPAVARIIVPEGSGVSFGSGTLVAVSEDYGLVVTNWHVVRDAREKIVVMFPGGFTSEAKLLRVNREWDLAALSIRPPDIQPVPISSTIPRRGDTLTIAGWGKGSYRMATGRCTQYLSPGGNHPFELLELTTSARNGDSGGPIFNHRGELAGVLFGSGFGRTTGSYCGRVQWFLATVDRRFRPDAPEMPPIYRPPTRPGTSSGETRIAARDEQRSPTAAIGTIHPTPSSDPPRQERPLPISIAAQHPPAPSPPSRREASPIPSPLPSSSPPAVVEAPPYAGVPYTVVPSAMESPKIGQPESPAPTAPTRADQLRTILAGIGIFFLLFHGLRLLGGLQ